MKSMIYFAAISCLLITSSCERAGIQTAQAVADDVAQQLTLRNNVDDCDDCNPDQECCCILYIDYSMVVVNVDIIVCGFSKGPDACGPYSPGGGCPPFSGVEEVISFDMATTSHYLCMRKGRPFRIFNSNLMSGVTLRLVCDVDSPSPKTTIIILGPGESKFFNAGTDCNAPECD